MVFAKVLAAFRAIAPASSVATAPLLTKIGSEAVGATAGTVAGLATGAAAGTVAELATGAGAGTVAGLASGAAASTATAGPPAVAVPATAGKKYSWTCWKKIIHDESDRNEAVLLSYIFEHPNVKSVSEHEDHFIVENIWGEKFKIYFITLSNGDIAAHAV